PSLHRPQRPAAPRRQFEQGRPRAGEMTEHELAVAKRTSQGAGVAVDAQDCRRHFRARLADDQLPRSLTLRALANLDVPQPRDRWDVRVTDNDWREPLGFERIRRAARPAVVFALERPVLDRSYHLRPIFVEGKLEGAVLERPARRRNFFVVLDSAPL